METSGSQSDSVAYDHSDSLRILFSQVEKFFTEHKKYDSVTEMTYAELVYLRSVPKTFKKTFVRRDYEDVDSSGIKFFVAFRDDPGTKAYFYIEKNSKSDSVSIDTEDPLALATWIQRF
jgi:hypothetical protein